MSFQKALDEISERFIKAMNSGDAEGCAAAYAEDALVYFNASSPVKGREDVRRAYADAIAQGQRLKALRVIYADSDDSIGFGIQAYEGANSSGMVMFGMRKNGAGAWHITTEAFIAP